MKDKEQTKRKLIDAVGQIFRQDGYRGLGVNRIARQAMVDKKLIYRYFGSYERLLEAYVVETDYWLKFSQQIQKLDVPKDLEGARALVVELLQNQFSYFHQQTEMQELILWELSSNSDLMRSIHRTREQMGQQVFELTDQFQPNRNINFRAVAALMVGGIYYMILHSRNNGGMFSDINIGSSEGRKEILKAIEQVVSLSLVERSG